MQNEDATTYLRDSLNTVRLTRESLARNLAAVDSEIAVIESELRALGIDPADVKLPVDNEGGG